MLNAQKVTLTPLAVGFAQPASSYTMMTVSDGDHQSFFIDGTKVGAVVNKEFPMTFNVGLALINLGRSASASDQPSSASTWSASRPSRNSLTARLDLST